MSLGQTAARHCARREHVRVQPEEPTPRVPRGEVKGQKAKVKGSASAFALALPPGRHRSRGIGLLLATVKQQCAELPGLDVDTHS
jgi:hypothetical protein